MRIGIPKEILNNEFRVAITPSGVKTLVDLGKEVIIETNAGKESGFLDKHYANEGAKIVNSPEEVWDCDIILKVKEPQKSEYKFLREDLIIFTYFHLAASKSLADVLIKNKVTAIGYETVKNKAGKLPLLMPMSEVAGRMSVQIAANLLEKQNGGSGILLGGVPGVSKGKVTIIGGGVVGTNAARIAIGLGAQVTVLNRSAQKLVDLDGLFGHRIQTLISNSYNIAKAVKNADIVIGAVLVPGAKAPKLVTEEMVKTMSPGSVIVDVAIDQGGIFETADKTTTHENPTYIKHGVIHYAVPNIPGAVSRTSTIALTNVTLPYVVDLVEKGLEKAFKEDLGFKEGLNTYKGHITNEAVADSLGLEYKNYDEI